MIQASFYSYALFGKRLDGDVRGGGPQATGGKKAKLSGLIKTIALEIGEDHIK